MTVRRLISVLSVATIASASIAAAQSKARPKAGTKATPKAGPPAPLAPAKDAAPSTTAGGGKAAPASAPPGGEGSAVQMTEDPPPSDLNGTDENPEAPRSGAEVEATTSVTAVAPVAPRSGYPLEEVARPITLPQNMSEVSLAPHAAVSPYAGATALRARYGITSKVQLGLTYLIGGIFDDPATLESKQGFHPGKAVGVDVTVMLQDWIGVQVGVPVYISPVAVSLAIGAPLKLRLGDKLALGGFDDLLNIRLKEFAPSFYQEAQNAANANDRMSNTIKSRGELRFSAYGLYQYRPNFAIVGRTGIQMEDFATGKTSGCTDECLTTFIRAGFEYSPRRYLDLGLSLGFDDLSRGGSFAPAGYLAFRI